MSKQDVQVCEESSHGIEGEGTNENTCRYTQNSERNTEKGIGAVSLCGGRTTEIKTESSSTDTCLEKRCARDTENECPPPKRHQHCPAGRDLPVHPQPQSLSPIHQDLPVHPQSLSPIRHDLPVHPQSLSPIRQDLPVHPQSLSPIRHDLPVHPQPQSLSPIHQDLPVHPQPQSLSPIRHDLPVHPQPQSLSPIHQDLPVHAQPQSLSPIRQDLPVHPQSQSLSQRLLDLEQRMCQELATLHFSSPVTHIYNPLSYAAEPHCCYVHSYANSTKRILFFGMNPGPFGMAQTGVPFSDASIATGWLGVSGHVGKPPVEHPKRPIIGLSCSRHEVSGSRFWGLYQDLCGKPETFFANCFVHNYCPLCFMGPTGKNVTPPQLKVAERNALQDICDRYLLLVVRLLGVEWLIAVGKYAENRARKALQSFERDVKIASITHPSPINPAANKDWKGLARSQLAALGLLDIVRGRVKQEECEEPVAKTFSVEGKREA